MKKIKTIGIVKVLISILTTYCFICCISENKLISRSENILIANLDNTETSQFKYSNIFKSVTAICLNEKSAMLGAINKMQVYNNQLFLLDSRITKKVYILDKKGTLLNEIGNIGLGPKEYMTCDDFTINKDTDELYIYDSRQKKIYKYDISSGKFKGPIFIDKNIDFNYIS